MVPSLNYAVLTDALSELKEGNIHRCEALGFTYEEMNVLNQLSLDELFIISRSSVQFMSITVNHEFLRKILVLARQEVHRQQQIDRAIRLGSSIALLSQYFGLTSNEVCIRRRLLGVKVPHGRTPIPEEDVDAEIWLRWQSNHPGNIASLTALDVMMLITEELAASGKRLSLTAIYNRIALCEKEATDKGDSHAR